MIGSLTLSSATPLTNDVLTGQVNDATDINNDQISFLYEWCVNGVAVQTTTSSSTTDTLDLSQSGFGDKGDTITVTVTPSDATSSGLAVAASAIIADSPPESAGVNQG